MKNEKFKKKSENRVVEISFVGFGFGRRKVVKKKLKVHTRKKVKVVELMLIKKFNLVTRALVVFQKETTFCFA